MINKLLSNTILLAFLLTVTFANDIKTIKKDYIVKNKDISDEVLKKYYPEIFTYDGNICYCIKDVYIYKSKNIKSSLKNEIEKLKLLNILHNIKYEYKTKTKLNMQTVQAVGIICNKTLHLRNKDYKVSDNIFSNYYIKLIDSNNSNIVLYVK